MRRFFRARLFAPNFAESFARFLALWFALPLVLFCALFAVPAALAQTTQIGDVTVTKTATPERRLDFEVTLPATPAAVWEALSTSAGLSTWLWRDCVVDLRVGGDWLVKFPGGSTGGGTILAFVPGKQIEIAALAPEQFPTVRRERTRAVFSLEPVQDGKATRLHLAQTGWKEGEEWDKAYAYLAGGNAELLNNLHKRFVDGPFDWDALMKQMEKPQPAAPAKQR